MAKDKEKEPKRGKSKERNGKEKEKSPKKTKKVTGPQGEPQILECTLRKIIKEKKDGLYSEEEAKKIFYSIKEKKSGFPVYTASVYSNMIYFAPKKKDKRIPAIKYEDIKQVLRIPDNLDSFILYVPKTKKTKQFSGIFTWSDASSAEKFETALRAYHKSKRSGNSAENSNNINNSNGNNAFRSRRRKPMLVNGNYDEPRPESLIISASPRRNRQISDSELYERSGPDPGPFTVTYTHYAPNKGGRFRTRSYSDYSTSTDSYYRRREFSASDYMESYEDEDSSYICRDPDSVFYGERMSPKSQYVDRLMRQTARWQYSYE